MPDNQNIKSYIGSQWISPKSGKTYETKNPATGETLATVGLADREDAQSAIFAATRGNKELAKMTNWERAALCFSVADEMLKRRDNLAKVLSDEQGKPLMSEAYSEIDAAIAGFRQAGEQVKWHDGRVIPAETQGKRVISFRQPIGVFGVITPWNFPINIPVEYLAPCLAAGNGVVWVPSPSTALCAATLMECIVAAGFPDGAINLVIGEGAQVGDEVVTNTGVHAVGLTGSPTTGNIVARQGAGKPMVLELGGNGPLIVLDDADLEKAAAAAAFGSFFNAGQVCAASGRILATKKTHDKLVELIAAEASKLRVGLPSLPDTTMGSLHDSTVANRVDEHIADATKSGAEIAFGGRRENVAGGTNLFYQPTVLANVSHSALANTSETFGPVAPVVRCEDESQMLSLANQSNQGLAMAVYTKDMAKAFQFGENLQAGLVNINSPTCYWELQIPFGGAAGKHSGVGRIGGTEMLNQVTQIKTITFDIT